MAERRVSVRIAATGGDQLKAELSGIGQTGQRALEGIQADSQGAAQGLTAVGGAAGSTLAQMEALAARAGRAAAALRNASAPASPMQARVNQATGVATGQSTRAIIEQGRALDDLRAKYNPLFGVVRSYKAEVSAIRQAHLEGAISADEMTAAIQRERQASLASIAALKGRTTGLTQMAGASRMAAFQSRMLMFQLNDVFVSLASGMNPMMVFVQQGAQIQQIYGGQGGVRAALADTSRMIGSVVTRFPPLTAAIVAATAAVAGMRREINATSGVTVGYGDVALAVWQTVRDALWNVLKPAVDAIAPWFAAAWEAAVEGVRIAGNAIINGWKVVFEAIGTALDSLPPLFQAAFMAAKAEALYQLSDLAAGAFRLLDGVAEGLNNVFGTSFGGPAALDEVRGALNKMGNDALVASQQAAGRAAGAWDGFGGRARGIMGEDPMGDFFDEVSIRAVNNALSDTEDEADKAGGAMKKAGKDAKDGMDEAKTGIAAVRDALSNYTTNAMNWGKGVGDTIVGAFRSAEDAVAEFVKTGKLEFGDFVGSILADMARLATRTLITGPLANAVLGAFGGLAGGSMGGAGGVVQDLSGLLPSFAGGGDTGNGPRIGGLDGRGGFLAMMHPRETVRDRTRGSGEAMNINISLAGARGDQELQQMVMDGVQSGLAAYDRRLPGRVKQINRDPRLS